MEGVTANATNHGQLIKGVNKLTDIVSTLVDEQAMQEARISMLEADVANMSR